MNNLEEIARKIKKEVGQFDTDIFARQMTSYINGITLPWNSSIIDGLISPFRQLFYLFNLNITSPVSKTYRNSFDQNRDWPKLVSMLKEMEVIHKYEYGELKPFADTLLDELEPEEVLRRRQIGSCTYTNFFHVGPLHFEEQAIEKLGELYRNFNTELKNEFGWNTIDILALYDRLDSLRKFNMDKVFLKQPNKESNKDVFKAEVSKALTNGMSFVEAIQSISDFPNDMFRYNEDPSIVNVFSIDDLADCPKSLIDTVLEELTTTRLEDNNFLFFSQPNQLYKKPIYKLTNGDFLVIDHRVLLNAMSSLLYEKCSVIIKDIKRVTQARDKYLERKLEEVFTEFYKPNKLVKILPSYYLEKGGKERDLLILTNKTAIIIEAKAGKIREPMYDPDKAYDRIWKDFKDTIDYGYEQAYSVKEKIMTQKPFDVFNKKMDVLMTINPKSIREIFTIIVTYNKFGQVQSDLQMMLDLYDEDNQYPWAICVDDLEIFLLGLRKQKMTENDFYRFLRQRQNLHGRVIVNDEGQITGQFLKHKRILPQNGIYRFSPKDDLIYDELYSRGLGFKNERGMDRKTNPKFMHIF
ncbi:hypothetical protein PBAC_19310 [Pedobacter glucosidilyticus]|nr:hypothetical protein [Pedobacter glucosidilyticus]KHJ37919.1 hypothetical protein PBAC_19310 [Pedobacter glucosidilyticus]